MKSSFEHSSRFTMASNSGTLRSRNCRARQALARRRLLHLLAVLVGAGEEIDVVAVEPHEAGDRVGRDHFIGVADMRRAVRIRNRGGDVERRPCRVLGGGMFVCFGATVAGRLRDRGLRFGGAFAIWAAREAAASALFSDVANRGLFRGVYFRFF